MKKNIFYNQLNLGANVLSGLCLCITMHSCDTDSGSGGYGSTSSDLSSSPSSVNVNSLKQMLSQENIHDNKISNELKIYEEIGKTLSKEQVEKELKANYQKSKDGKGDFKDLSQQSQACAIAVNLYAEGKDIYSLQEDKDCLYKMIFPKFAELWNENKNIDKIKAVEICLNRLKNDSEAIKKTYLENISMLATSILNLLQSVNSDCNEIKNNVVNIKNNVGGLKPKIDEILKKFRLTDDQVRTINSVLDGFDRNITKQVESANKKLKTQASDLKKQEKNVQDIRSMVQQTQSQQVTSNELLLQLQETMSLLQKNIQDQNDSNKKQLENSNKNENNDISNDFNELWGNEL